MFVQSEHVLSGAQLADLDGFIVHILLSRRHAAIARLADFIANDYAARFGLS